MLIYSLKLNDDEYAPSCKLYVKTISVPTLKEASAWILYVTDVDDDDEILPKFIVGLLIVINGLLHDKFAITLLQSAKPIFADSKTIFTDSSASTILFPFPLVSSII